MDTQDGIQRSQGLLSVDLDDMSVGDMEDYIVRLSAEIARVRAAIDRRGGQISAAEKLFKI